MIDFLPYVMLGIVAMTLIYLTSDFNFSNKKFQ